MRLDTDLALKAGKYLASLWENISLLVVAGFCQCLSCCVNIIRVNISKNHHLSWQQVIMGLNMRKKLTHWTWHYRADWTNGFQEWEGSIFEGDGDNVATFMANFTLFKAPVLLLEASIDPMHSEAAGCILWNLVCISEHFTWQCNSLRQCTKRTDSYLSGCL